MIEQQRRTPRQTTSTVVMISPDQFGFNPQTAETNTFQNKTDNETKTRDQALTEFNGMIESLTQNNIDVLILPSRQGVVTPDAVFPNNWFSHHQEGKLVIYPMLAPNRRAERQPENLQGLLTSVNIQSEILDLSSYEEIDEILEGTGSLILDRVNKMAFAMESPRTTLGAFHKWCQEMNYEGVFFHAYDKDSLPIYHTNVVMSMGEKFAVVCLEAIKDADEKAKVIQKIQEYDREIIPISLEQVYSFCGNILELRSKSGDPKIVMSESAFNGFTRFQLEQLKEYGNIIPVSIPTIESVGGGSARCMIAEIFVE